MRIGAPSIGPAENRKTDQKPGAPSTAVSTWGSSFRTAIGGALFMMPSILPAETPQAVTPMVRRLPSKAEQMQLLEGQLQTAWASTSRYLTEQSLSIEREYEEQMKILAQNGLSGNVKQLDQSWNRVLDQTWNNEDGRGTDTNSRRMRHNEELDRVLDCNRWLMPWKEIGIDDALIEEAEFSSLRIWQENLEERYKELLMTDETGRCLRLYPDEFADDPTLTPEAYWKLLMKRLKTPQDLAMYVKLFFEYTVDTDDETEPLRVGTQLTQKEHWQTTMETIRRGMRGDCDDLTIFCRDALTEIGKRPVALYIYGERLAHYTCVWAEKQNDRYVVSEIGTEGWFEDGQIRVLFQFGAAEDPKPYIRPAGHDKLEDAFRTALEHFRVNKNFSLSDIDGGQIRIQIPVSEWSKAQSILHRTKPHTFNELAVILIPPEPEPMITANAPAPAPPPE